MKVISTSGVQNSSVVCLLCGIMKKEWKSVEERKRNMREKEYSTHAQK